VGLAQGMGCGGARWVVEELVVGWLECDKRIIFNDLPLAQISQKKRLVYIMACCE
jgi:hypothetical protein